tara:strand:+ start:11073 stop:11489 length:417 start_codon:yes stop_codon:yes gene_type:complete
MSLIEKLKNLINDVEQSETTENLDETQIEEALGDILSEEKEEVPQFPEYLDCSEEETLEYLEKINSIKEVKYRLADLICSFDKVKNDLKALAKEKETETYTFLGDLKHKYNVPAEGYIISLPSHVSEGRIRFEKEKEE